MKKDLLAGIVILLPVVVTIWVVSFLVNLLTKPFVGLVTPLFHHFTWFYLPDAMILILSKVLILILLVATIFAVGLVANWFFIHKLIYLGDQLVHRIPLINTIYKSVKEVVNSLFSPSSPSFSQVVLVPFPSEGALSIGLITKEEVPILEKAKATETISVFVPGTPNPTVGFLLMFKKEQMIFTDLKVDEAMKFVVSCGVMFTDFNRIQR